MHVLMWTIHAALAQEVEEPPSLERFFMPAIEAGVIWSGDSDIDLGLTFRTSVDWRLRRISAPFLRLSYDATTAQYTQRNLGELARLTSTLATHDIVLGGGVRFGPSTLQVVTSVQSGIQFAQIPALRQDGEDLVVASQDERYGITIGGLGAEWYLEEEAAITLEWSGRLRHWDNGVGAEKIAVGCTIGVTTAI